MRDIVERAHFALCLAFAYLLRPARYSKACRACDRGERHVRLRRAFYAPLLVRTIRPLMRFLGAGVRILPQREWEERERHICQRVYRTSIRVEQAGALVVPCLAGHTLATLLADDNLEERIRKWLIERAVIALAHFHSLGCTHGDATAHNVLLDGGIARWFDVETSHESDRPAAWQRADDLRALLVTCLAATVPERRDEIIQLILDVYADEAVIRHLAASFTSTFRRPLIFHLSQAALPFECYRDIRKLLRNRGRSAYGSSTS